MDELADFLLSLVLGLVILSGALVTVWKRLAKTKCPECHRLRARETLDEEFEGVYKKWFRPRVRTNFIPGTQEEIAFYEKYTLYHRCQFCGHEWTSVETRKI